jgi:uncharacterized membrane protein
MQTIVMVLAAGVLVAGAIAFTQAPARADLRFCNQSNSTSRVMEGHMTSKSGFTVTGTYTVRSGTCGVIIPGKLTAKRFYLRILAPRATYGGAYNLCVMDAMHFSITDELAASFRCKTDDIQKYVHIKGFTNPEEHLAGFLDFNTNGEPSVTFTQLKNNTFRDDLK